MNQINHDDLKARIRKSNDFTGQQKRYLMECLDMVDAVGEKAFDSAMELIADIADSIEKGLSCHSKTDGRYSEKWCDNCGCVFRIYAWCNEDNTFCPHCGARMDGG